MSEVEPSKEELREAFRNALNRGDVETAGKIAIYSILTPESADLFSASLIAIAESIMMAREDNFKNEDVLYAHEGIARTCHKLNLEITSKNIKTLMDLNIKWIAKERRIFNK